MRTAAFLLLAASCLFGTDISGKWQFSVETTAGSGEPTFVLEQEGEKLAGTYSGVLGQAKVNGTVKGDDVVIEFEAGDPVNGTVRYSGKVDASGAKMSGKVQIGNVAEGTFSATKQ